MDLQYVNFPEYHFSHWLTYQTNPSNDNIDTIMDINHWLGQHCGELGVNWGYERVQDTSQAPQGLNPVRVRLHYTVIFYYWRFLEKRDAMLLKLTWF